MRGRSAIVLFLVAGVAGCASRQILGEDGSISYGPSNAGALLTPAELPPSGVGYRVPETWRRRGLRYGTDELVGLVQYVGRELGRTAPGREVAVADLSTARGGPSAWHRSHQTGRDVDLVFLARDAGGQPVAMDRMREFGADGWSRPELDAGGAPVAPVQFDDAANWLLVRALVANPVADVQYVFIADDLRQRVLDHAEAIDDDPDVIAAAATLLAQPGDSLPHDDHMHVRILCSPRDRELGCRDAGALHWRKKDFKYARGPMAGASGARAIAAP